MPVLLSGDSYKQMPLLSSEAAVSFLCITVQNNTFAEGSDLFVQKRMRPLSIHAGTILSDSSAAGKLPGSSMRKKTDVGSVN